MNNYLECYKINKKNTKDIRLKELFYLNKSHPNNLNLII